MGIRVPKELTKSVQNQLDYQLVRFCACAARQSTPAEPQGFRPLSVELHDELIKSVPPWPHVSVLQVLGTVVPNNFNLEVGDSQMYLSSGKRVIRARSFRYITPVSRKYIDCELISIAYHTYRY